ncbi:MAG: quinoprotein relay system zinc metallohydrolase 2 [Candidatus Thiodiazotropha sp. (ex Codakia rugifera)]|nr:quinoprotein relay system zinc metallohydrolase 2 [Candidatus Thiodiazotropha sp. (ex Codakia rugifera)]
MLLLCLDTGILKAQPSEFMEIAPGIYLRPGIQQNFASHNRGHIANIGFIVGKQAVAVIDTGSSYQEGLTLRRAIREITALPIQYVILTHMHPDHTLGAAAFDQDAPVYIGHAQLKDALIRRQTHYLDRLKEVLGSTTEGTRLVLPSAGVEVGRAVRLELGDRILELQAYPTAHTNNDLSVYDRNSGTLWLSDLLFVERIPVVDGSLLGWLGVIDYLDQSEAKRVVPGHGPVVTEWKASLADQRRYLDALLSGIRGIVRQNGTIEQAIEQVGQEEKDNWLLFDEYHGRNVTASFVELEWE